MATIKGLILTKLFKRRCSVENDGTVTPFVIVQGDGTAGAPGAAVSSVQGVDNGTPMAVAGKLKSVSQGFTRPGNVTGYTAGDVVSNSESATTPMTFANLLRVSGGNGWLTGARLVTNLKSITPRFRVHLFNVSSATLAVDNLPYKSLYVDTSKRIGTFDLPSMSTSADATNSDMSGAADLALRIPLIGVDANVYAVLEALDAFTPANAQQFTLVLTVDQN